jgi:hypothetical protein
MNLVAVGILVFVAAPAGMGTVAASRIAGISRIARMSENLFIVESCLPVLCGGIVESASSLACQSSRLQDSQSPPELRRRLGEWPVESL